LDADLTNQARGMQMIAARSYALVTGTVLCTLLLAPLAATAGSLEGLGELPGDLGTHHVTDISADGSTVVGHAGSPSSVAFRWTQSAGLESLFQDLQPVPPAELLPSVSGDGNIVVGGQYIWYEGGALESVVLYGGAENYYSASGISSDGSVVTGIGCSIATPSSCAGWTLVNSVFAWTGSSFNGIVSGDGSTWTVSGPSPGLHGRATIGLGPLPGYSAFGFGGLSNTGDVVVGCSFFGLPDERAYRWTATSETTDALGELPGGSDPSCALDVTADGDFVVGYGSNGSGQQATIWDPQNGMQLLGDLLDARAIDHAGWILREAVAVSDDGQRIAGNGINPQGNPEGFVVILDEASNVPSLHPAGFAVLLGALVAAGARASRARQKHPNSARSRVHTS
jgi:uncharacterized membrane protein